MRRNTAELLSGIATAVIATIVYALWRAPDARWAGTWPGHLLGLLGALLMLWATVDYSRRKRRQEAGGVAMRTAMRSHVMAGLLGPYLVILHSGFVLGGLAGLLTWVMVLVVASGLIGRAVFTALPRPVSLVDPVRAAMLDAELARLETENADLLRRGDSDPDRREAIRREMIALRHREELARSEWRTVGGVGFWRRALGLWWYLHIPMSAALWVLALAHIAAALYYGTLSR